MTRPITSIFASLALLLTLAAPAAAQFPPASAEQREAGARVTEVRFGSEELVVPRGEIVTLQAGLYDSEGNAVTGAVAVVFAQVGVSPTFAPIEGRGIELTGDQPGTGNLTAVVMVPEDEGGMFGVAGAR